MYPKKTQRNKELVKKRKSNPKKWTWGELSKHFNITRPMCLKIFRKYENDF